MLLDLESVVKKLGVQLRGVFHVGAYDAIEVHEYNRLGIKPAIFFEPQDRLFRIAKKNIEGFEWASIYDLALGNSEGFINLNVSVTENGDGSGASSSVLVPKIHLEQYPNITFPSALREEVYMTTLDNFVLANEEDNNIRRERFNFINLDVQGYELEVLKGAEETLKSIDLIMCEVNRAEVYEDCSYVGDIDSYLGDFGFDRVMTYWAGDTWGDAIYYKDN